jgi:hypothetical protein
MLGSSCVAAQPADSQEGLSFMKFVIEVLTEVPMKATVFWEVTPYTPVNNFFEQFHVSVSSV